MDLGVRLSSPLLGFPASLPRSGQIYPQIITTINYKHVFDTCQNLAIDGIALLEQAADVLGELDPASLSDDELGQTLVDWQRIESRLAASKARLTASFDLRGAYRADGAKSAAAWLARKTNGSPAAARAQTRLARRLRLMPLTAAALAAGQISERHAEILAGLAGSNRKPIADAFPHAEGHLLEYAKTLDFERFVTAVRYWEAVVDQDGTEDQAASDHESRHVHLSETFRGNWVLDGQLDPIAGTEVATALRRIYDELFAADWAEAKAVHGDDICVDHLARNPTQRRADALIEMARRSATTPANGKQPRPLLVIHLGHDTLNRLCELASGTVIAPGQLVPYLGQADIQRIVYDGKSRRINELGERTRVFSGPLREAILLRDRRCVEPGCGVPADECEVDHVVPYAKGGVTTQDNGVARCGHHNRRKSDTDPDDHYDDAPPPDTS
jgi:hypothetical protein